MTKDYKNSIGSRNKGFDDAGGHFRVFAKQLETAIARYGDLSEEDLLDRQKRQVEGLVALEKKFRRVLVNHPEGENTYLGFIDYIVSSKRNILSARPFFRERTEVFNDRMIDIFKHRAGRRLFKFNINYSFVCFVMRFRKWSPAAKADKEVLDLAKQITLLRNELVEMNMPLAISRARIFYSWTPKSHLSYMDLIQITAEGLLTAVDKFCLPFSRVFRSVCIGRMVGNLIEEYNQTSLHFYPNDKRKIYRANKARARQSGPTDYNVITNTINEDPDRKTHTTVSEITELMSAASTISANTRAQNRDGDDLPSIIDGVSSDPMCRPDYQVEASMTHTALHRSLQELTLLQQKRIRMRGV